MPLEKRGRATVHRLLISAVAPTLILTALTCDAVSQQCERPSEEKRMDKVSESKNVLGQPLQECGCTPMTGFYRDGFCETGARDLGSHIVCAVMTEEFLVFTKTQGNDLSTPAPQFSFPGLKAGDRWCLCVSRWKEAYEAGVAPPVILEATHERALGVASIEELKASGVQ